MSDTQSQRRIAHLDMDAFYASIELLRYPELKGMPVVIGGKKSHVPVVRPDGTRQFYRLRDYVGRGVVATSTYEARHLGIFSGMGLMKAAQIAPNVILLPTDFDSYDYYSQRFKNAVISIAPTIEDVGIDEIYIDLSDLSGDARSTATQIKAAVYDATKLSCSIGIAPNKLLAKICSDLEKPNGLTVLEMAEIQTRIWPMHVRKINGIGPKAEDKLRELGVTTIRELALLPPEVLLTHFGTSYGGWLHDAAHGRDDRPLVTHWEPKSLGKETTFERDLHPRENRRELSAILTQLCVSVGDELKSRGYVGRTIGVKIKYDNYASITRDHTWPTFTNDPVIIRRAATECLKKAPLNRRLRLLGVRVGTLRHQHSPPSAAESLQLCFDFYRET